MGISLFTTASIPALGPTQPLIQWVPGALCLRVKRPGRKADQLPPSSAEVKECVELYIHSTNTPSWRGARLRKAQGQLYFYLSFNLHVPWIFLLLRIPAGKNHDKELVNGRDLWQQVQAKYAVLPHAHSSVLSETVLPSSRLELPIGNASTATEKKKKCNFPTRLSHLTLIKFQ
jgi:hypothetical protein